MSAMKLLCFVLVATHGMVGSAIIVQLRGSNAHDSWKADGAMQPTVVAKTLSKVESEWRSQALQFVECNAEPNHGDCRAAAGTFQKSCGTVVTAVVAASSGDRETVRDYMAVVCDEPQLRGWKQGRCRSFAQAILERMTANNYENRQHLYVTGLCAHFWNNMSSTEGAIVAEEHRLQAKQIEAENVRRANRAREAAEVTAANAARKTSKEAAEARHKAVEARIQEAKKRWQAQAARQEAEEKKKAAERTAALKAAAELKAAKKAAVEKKARERSDAARKAAEAQDAAAEAKLKEAEKQTQEVRQHMLEAEAAKAVIRGAQPAKASSETRAPTHPKTASPVLNKTSSNSKIAAANATQTVAKKTFATGKQLSK